MIDSRFDASAKAYLDWICALPSYSHRGVAQRFYRSIPNSETREIGIWIDIE